MQTFLPYNNFLDSCNALDNRRLVKQCLEACQILNVLFQCRAGKSPGYRNHPAVRMWAGHEISLHTYTKLCCKVYSLRFLRNHACEAKADALVLDGVDSGLSTDAPAWMGDPRVHSAMRGRLLAKAPAFYARYGWQDKPVEVFPWELITNYQPSMPASGKGGG
jgi:hypothetical protein